MPDLLCMFKDCKNPRDTKNRSVLCHMHRQRDYRGTPMDQPRKAANGEKLDWLRRAVGMKTDVCVGWPFKYDSSKNYYGTVMVDGKRDGAHRWMLLNTVGEPPEGHAAAHSCGNHKCLNPAHLRWATYAENEADKIRHGTDNRGERHPMAKLTEKDVLAIRASTITGKALAEKYKTSKQYISNIRRGRVWKQLLTAGEHLPDHRKTGGGPTPPSLH